MRRMIVLLPVLVSTAIAACRGNELAAGVDESTYVTTMAALHRISLDDTLNNEMRERARNDLLQSRGLTPEQLTAAASALADDPDRALAVWRRITEPPKSDSTVADTSGPGATR